MAKVLIHKMHIQSIGLVVPNLQLGGASAVTVWTLEALKARWPIKLLTFGIPDINSINRFYGTNLSSNDFDLIQYLYPDKGILGRGYLLKHYLLMYYLKKEQDGILFFSVSNEMDFGKKGIQYIHLPILKKKEIQKLGLANGSKWYHQNAFIRDGYHTIYKAISKYSSSSMKSNTTLVNSNWTGELVQELYGIKTKTIYPPVHITCSPRMFFDRENGFVYAGRIAPEKKIEGIITILNFLRERGKKIHLHLVGPIENSRYLDDIMNRIPHVYNWVKIEGVLERDGYEKIIAQHKFGISGMEQEHFGISLAEMVKLGCIVFVPDGGGQREIINYDERLIYTSVQDAVEKITKVLDQPKLQEKISEEMYANGERFSTEHFMRQIRNAVQTAMNKKANTSNIGTQHG